MSDKYKMIVFNLVLTFAHNILIVVQWKGNYLGF